MSSSRKVEYLLSIDGLLTTISRHLNPLASQQSPAPSTFCMALPPLHLGYKARSLRSPGCKVRQPGREPLRPLAPNTLRRMRLRLPVLEDCTSSGLLQVPSWPPSPAPQSPAISHYQWSPIYICLAVA